MFHMKIYAFEVRGDEREYFAAIKDKMNIELECTEAGLEDVYLYCVQR